MNPSIQTKLSHLVSRYEDIGAMLSDQVVINDQNRFRNLAKEYAQLEPLVRCYQKYEQLKEDITQTKGLLEDEDASMRELAQEELAQYKQQKAALEQELHLLLLPTDPNDKNNVFVEIRAGTGGDEAAIFVGDLFRMYSRYAEQQRWQVEVITAHEGDHGGYKEIILRIMGTHVYGRLKFESGAHRVQRVPETESQGRVHTSACTVAVLPEVEAVSEIEINPADLKVDTYRASGAGGQHVNKTDSAIRITHLPTGTVVECQDERSQHKNRARAMSVLQAKLLAAERDAQNQERAQTRRLLVGSGDRSERIRTYNFPQGRITDHRINLTLYKLDDIMQGQLNPVIEPLIQAHQMDLLSALGDADQVN